MRQFPKAKLVAHIILLCCLTGGCGVSPAFLVATRITQDKNEFFRSFPELTTRKDIMKIAAETGKALNYESRGIFHTSGFDGLALKIVSDSAAKQILLPGGTTTEIKITCPTPRMLAEMQKSAGREKFAAQDYQRATTFVIELEHRGYWGASGKEKAEQVFNEFIDNFLERVRKADNHKSS